METATVKNRSMQKSMDSILQDALDILESDDGKSFEEKKALLLRMLSDKQDALLAGRLVDIAIAGKNAAQIRDSFWKFGKEIAAPNGITLRKVSTADRDVFLALQRCYSPTPAMLEQEAYQNMLWSEHTEQKSLMLSIYKHGVYVGYCGIQDLSKKIWEISVELLPKNTKQGIGYVAISAMLDTIRDRLGMTKYRVRIEPTNQSSQRLFEKLGAVPNGISELWVHDREDLDQLENDGLQLIDDTLIAVAEKFAVEPRKLLSHVLEYKLTWQ